MRTLPRLLFPVLFLVLMPACAALKSRSPLFERVGKSNMSVGELRIRMGDMARRFPGVLEATADVAAERSHSAGTREALLRFKSNAVPVMQSALLQPDPVAGLIDGWALLAQLEQSLPTRAPPEVVDTLQRSFEELESEVELLWRELSGRQDVSNLRALVHAWAAEHPLTGTLVSRESTVPLLAEFTDRSGVGLLGATAAALQDTRDLVQRVDLYVGTLPRQVRWQAELATQEVLEAPTLVSAVHELERAVDVLVRVGALADRTPQWVTGERQSLQDFLSSERRAVLDGVRGERVAVLDSLHVERVETLAQLEPLARGWVDHAFDRATALVNHVFLWLLGLLVLFLLGLLLVTALLARAWRQGEGLPWDRSRGGVGSSREQRALGEPAMPGPAPSMGEHPAEPHH